MRVATSNPHPCPVCSGDTRPHLTSRDYLYQTTDAEFSIWKCRRCKAESIVPPPTSDDLRSYYPEKYYSYAKGSPGLFAKLRRLTVATSYGGQASRTEKVIGRVLAHHLAGVPLTHRGDSSFLDVGCGSGENLRLLSAFGWRCAGFEVSGTALDTSDHRIRRAPSLEEAEFDSTYSYIRVWHVLEHVVDPHPFVDKLAKLLAPGGTIVFGLPNTASVYARLFRGRWYNRDIPRHVVNYDARYLQLLMSEHDLMITHIRHQSVGGLAGSLQYLLADFGINVNLINNPLVVLALWPLDIACDLLRLGDCVVVEAVAGPRHATQ